MKTIIYYFTGTGNSLAAARGICSRLDNCELVSIASLAKTVDRIKPGADRVGIVCPVYDFGLPSIVDGFVQRLDLSETGYSFAVLTMGGFGVSALHQLDDLVFVRNHRHLDAAFVVRMVGNFVPLYEPAKGAKREKLLKDADEGIAEIAKKAPPMRRTGPINLSTSEGPSAFLNSANPPSSRTATVSNTLRL